MSLSIGDSRSYPLRITYHNLETLEGLNNAIETCVEALKVNPSNLAVLNSHINLIDRLIAWKKKNIPGYTPQNTVQEAERVLETSKYAKSYVFAGRVSFNEKDYKKALMYFLKAYALDPDLKNINLFLGECYFYLKLYKKAIEELDKDLNRNVAESGKTLHLKGVCHKYLKEYVQAVECFTRYQERHGFHPTVSNDLFNTLVAMKKFGSAAEARRKDLPHFKNVSQVALELANFLLKIAKYPEAKKLLDELPAADRQMPYYFALGEYYFYQTDLPNLKIVLGKIKELDSKSIEYRLTNILLRYLEENSTATPKIVANFKALRKEAPNHVEVLRFQIEITIKNVDLTKDKDGCVNASLKALTNLMPDHLLLDNFSVIYACRTSQYQFALNLTEQMLKDFSLTDKKCSHDITHPIAEAYYFRAHCLIFQKRYAEAIEILKYLEPFTIFAAQKDSIKMHLAKCYVASDLPALALPIATELFTKNIRDEDIYIILVESLVKLRDIELARMYYKEGILLHPNSGLIKFKDSLSKKLDEPSSKPKKNHPRRHESRPREKSPELAPSNEAYIKAEQEETLRRKAAKDAELLAEADRLERKRRGDDPHILQRNRVSASDYVRAVEDDEDLNLASLEVTPRIITNFLIHPTVLLEPKKPATAELPVIHEVRIVYSTLDERVESVASSSAGILAASGEDDEPITQDLVSSVSDEDGDPTHFPQVNELTQASSSSPITSLNMDEFMAKVSTPLLEEFSLFDSMGLNMQQLSPLSSISLTSNERRHCFEVLDSLNVLFILKDFYLNATDDLKVSIFKRGILYNLAALFQALGTDQKTEQPLWDTKTFDQQFMKLLNNVSKIRIEEILDALEDYRELYIDLKLMHAHGVRLTKPLIDPKALNFSYLNVQDELKFTDATQFIREELQFLDSISKDDQAKNYIDVSQSNVVQDAVDFSARMVIKHINKHFKPAHQIVIFNTSPFLHLNTMMKIGRQSNSLRAICENAKNCEATFARHL